MGSLPSVCHPLFDESFFQINIPHHQNTAPNHLYKTRERYCSVPGTSTAHSAVAFCAVLKYIWPLFSMKRSTEWSWSWFRASWQLSWIARVFPSIVIAGLRCEIYETYLSSFAIPLFLSPSHQLISTSAYGLALLYFLPIKFNICINCTSVLYEDLLNSH